MMDRIERYFVPDTAEIPLFAQVERKGAAALSPLRPSQLTGLLTVCTAKTLRQAVTDRVVLLRTCFGEPACG